jgi:hypothetical protein
VRGVLAALHGVPRLQRLAVRGVRGDGTAPSKLTNLLAKQVHTRDGLDTTLLYEPCGAYMDGALCGRLCGDGDQVCRSCPKSLCGACADVMRRTRQPPCEHICISCLRQPLKGEVAECSGDCSDDANAWRALLLRRELPYRAAKLTEVTLYPSFCEDCSNSCVEDGCNDHAFCPDCATKEDGLYACADCGDVRCEHCAGDPDSFRREMHHAMVRCHNEACPAPRHVCARCASQKMHRCEGDCYEVLTVYCDACAPSCLRRVDGGFQQDLCKSCWRRRSGGFEEDEEDEDEEDEDEGWAYGHGPR